jgi:phenylalanyl-tRNA synthetase beta chain
MRIVYSQLKKHLPLVLSAEKTADILTSLGLEVEKIEHIGRTAQDLDKVVVAKVIACNPHPNADKLKITEIDNGTEILQVVCGASNVQDGQKVFLAQIGAKLKPTSGEAFAIQKAKIRGTESFGMLCAEDELGLGNSHAGIWVLPEDAPIGTPAFDYLQPESDVVFEIGLTPNRADAMSHYGVARDLAAYLAIHENLDTAKLSKPILPNLSFGSGAKSINVKDAKACPYYSALHLKNVKVQESPQWLKNKLHALGIASISNVVDITNYVMHDLGVPLHAVDAQKIGAGVEVSFAKQGETLCTLDGVLRNLHPDDLLIRAENGTPLCLAGVFGGKDSGVSSSTAEIFLEAAYFDPTITRKTAKRHALHTDASFRFERGIDIAMVNFALQQAAALMVELCGAEIATPVLAQELLPLPRHTEVLANVSSMAELLGIPLSTALFETVCGALDIHIASKNQDNYTLLVPSYRVDVKRQADIAEDILRLYGEENVPFPRKMAFSMNSHLEQKDAEAQQNEVAELLANLGFFEVMNNSLMASESLQKLNLADFPQENLAKLRNPLSLDLNVLRPDLLFSLLETLQFNQNRQQQDLRIFEFGKAYRQANNQYQESWQLAMAWAEKPQADHWHQSMGKGDVYLLKSAVLQVFANLSLVVQEKQTQNEIFSHALSYAHNNQVLATLGILDQKLLQAYDLRQNVFFASINWQSVLSVLGKTPALKVQDVPKTQFVRRDLSLLLDKNISFAELQILAHQTAGAILKQVSLFDVYAGKNLPADKKSYALSFVLQDHNQTLTTAEIDTHMQSIVEAYQKIGASLR